MTSSNHTPVILLGTLMSITAFSPSSNIGPHRQQQQHASLRTTPLGAAIYYPDGSSDYDEPSTYEYSNDIFGSSSYNSPAMPIFGQLASQLSSDPTTTTALAKLASAFSPPGFAIELDKVNDVRCLAVDNRHLEIEAVVCDDMECSSLLVPVEFPEACNVDDSDGLEECIIRNVNNLNVDVDHVLRERENVFAEEDEAQLAFEVLQSLDSEYLKPSSSAIGSSLPEWWVPPASPDDVAECDLIEQLLNSDDFRDMMRGLAEHGLLHDAEPGFLEGRSIRSVRTKAVGCAGMVLKVQLSLGGLTAMDNGGLNNEMVVDVPIKFDDMCASGCNDSIRDKVLMIVSSVNAI